MLVDIANVSETDEFDVCIIGTGPAGMSAAMALDAAGKRVLLLEAGGRDFTDETQDVYRGEIVGDYYSEDLDEWRLRFFGGTSNHWAGYCRPLDAWDFKAVKSEIEKWPITKADLDPYAARTFELLELPPLDGDRPFGTDSGFDISHFTYSPPTRFADVYGEQIEQSSNIFLALNAPVFRILTNGTAVTGLEIWQDGQPNKLVRARQYVLAAGGMESTRLLLWSNREANGALVRSPVLGKYYMDHPHFFVGEALVDTSLGVTFDERGQAYVVPTAAEREALGIYGIAIRLGEQSYNATKQMIADVACVAPDFGRWALSMLGRDLVCGNKLVAVWEQAPVEGNFIELSDQVDALGMPRVRLHYVKSEDDRKTALASLEKLGTYLAESGNGRLRMANWLAYEEPFPPDGFTAHHMGSTRMSETPAHGVVDSNCRVFGQENLYVASSSVFPRGGYANPTFTIVQLSLRLADHLAAQS